MKLLFKQRAFTWFDSYDIFDEAGNTVYTVQGRLAWGHRLEISDAAGNYLGQVRQEVLTFRPRFSLFIGENCVGQLRKEFALFKPVFTLDCNGWEIEGNFWEWDYRVMEGSRIVMTVSKELFHWTDTYQMDIADPRDALLCLMIVLAIDAEKCSRN